MFALTEKQLTGTARPGGPWLLKSQKQKLRCGGSLRRPGEKDFWLASKRFCQTIRCLRKGKQGLARTVFSRGGKLLNGIITEMCGGRQNVAWKSATVPVELQTVVVGPIFKERGKLELGE